MINKSASNNNAYPLVCLRASEDEEIFKTFKTIPEYTQILEHTSIGFGLDYYNLIKRDNPEMLSNIHMDKFKTNDKFGGSSVHSYENIDIAPSTLRYIKVLSDLIKIFGNLDGFKIAEIGGGYGGQCKIIKDYFSIKDYHIVDIKEANALSKKYLDKLNVKDVRFSESDNLKNEEYDLIISNYAYTELDRSLQDIYKKFIINHSENGYITCNFIINPFNGFAFDTYSDQELMSLNSKMEKLQEEPLTSPNNYIGVWKK